MTKLYIFAAVFLFWAALAASLMHVQLLASPLHKMQVPTYRSVAMRAIAVAQVHTSATPGSYN